MTYNNLNFQAGCKTTAMAIMPHTNVEKALDLVLNLDIPFWPQLPNLSFYDDMYAQASYDFPGVVIDHKDEKIGFNTARFENEISDYSLKMVAPESFTLNQDYAAVYQQFLTKDLQSYPAIHGQISGPVNLGFRINDEDSKPIVYNENVRSLLFDFIQRKFNAQYQQLQEKNPNAFVWLDEPGLIWVFSGLSGYNDVQARQEYLDFLAGLNGLKALHLCSNVNLPYLLELGIDFLSFDAYQIEVMPVGYAGSVAKFIKNGGIISWGIVPTEPVSLSKETPETLVKRLLDYWEVVSHKTGLPIKQIAEQALIAPAKCCVKSLEFSPSDKTVANGTENNPVLTTEEQSVEKAYAYLKTLSQILKSKFGL
ncbi:hypothetical protein ACFLUZ_05215 [Chloroflexota bacterium]